MACGARARYKYYFVFGQLRFTVHDALAAVLCVLVAREGATSPGLSLLFGVIVGIFVRPVILRPASLSKLLMGVSIASLGATITLGTVYRLGAETLVITVASLVITILLGFILGSRLSVDRHTSALIGVGTAICGASAIAALGSAAKLRGELLTVALGVILFYNTIALFLFPYIGRMVSLSPDDFAMWAGLAIHDTSSVLGATFSYDVSAVDVATTVKLARAVWILPMVAILAPLLNRESGKRASLPWFLWVFLFCSAGCTFVEISSEVLGGIRAIARASFAISLFLLGMSLDLSKVREAGFRPLVLGGVVWVVAAAISLAWVIYF